MILTKNKSINFFWGREILRYSGERVKTLMKADSKKATTATDETVKSSEVSEET